MFEPDETPDKNVQTEIAEEFLFERLPINLKLETLRHLDKKTLFNLRQTSKLEKGNVEKNLPLLLKERLDDELKLEQLEQLTGSQGKGLQAKLNSLVELKDEKLIKQAVVELTKEKPTLTSEGKLDWLIKLPGNELKKELLRFTQLQSLEIGKKYQAAEERRIALLQLPAACSVLIFADPNLYKVLSDEEKVLVGYRHPETLKKVLLDEKLRGIYFEKIKKLNRNELLPLPYELANREANQISNGCERVLVTLCKLEEKYPDIVSKIKIAFTDEEYKSFNYKHLYRLITKNSVLFSEDIFDKRKLFGVFSTSTHIKLAEAYPETLGKVILAEPELYKEFNDYQLAQLAEVHPETLGKAILAEPELYKEFNDYQLAQLAEAHPETLGKAMLAEPEVYKKFSNYTLERLAEAHPETLGKAILAKPELYKEFNDYQLAQLAEVHPETLGKAMLTEPEVYKKFSNYTLERLAEVHPETLGKPSLII